MVAKKCNLTFQGELLRPCLGVISTERELQNVLTKRRYGFFTHCKLFYIIFFFLKFPVSRASSVSSSKNEGIQCFSLDFYLFPPAESTRN